MWLLAVRRAGCLTEEVYQVAASYRPSIVSTRSEPPPRHGDVVALQQAAACPIRQGSSRCAACLPMPPEPAPRWVGPPRRKSPHAVRRQALQRGFRVDGNSIAFRSASEASCRGSGILQLHAMRSPSSVNVLPSGLDSGRTSVEPCDKDHLLAGRSKGSRSTSRTRLQAKPARRKSSAISKRNTNRRRKGKEVRFTVPSSATSSRMKVSAGYGWLVRLRASFADGVSVSG